MCPWLNHPMQLKCEVCTASRPTDYKPPAGYVSSDNKLRWMEVSSQRKVHLINDMVIRNVKFLVGYPQILHCLVRPDQLYFLLLKVKDLLTEYFLHQFCENFHIITKINYQE